MQEMLDLPCDLDPFHEINVNQEAISVCSYSPFAAALIVLLRRGRQIRGRRNRDNGNRPTHETNPVKEGGILALENPKERVP